MIAHLVARRVLRDIWHDITHFIEHADRANTFSDHEQSCRLLNCRLKSDHLRDDSGHNVPTASPEMDWLDIPGSEQQRNCHPAVRDMQAAIGLPPRHFH